MTGMMGGGWDMLYDVGGIFSRMRDGVESLRGKEMEKDKVLCNKSRIAEDNGWIAIILEQKKNQLIE